MLELDSLDDHLIILDGKNVQVQLPSKIEKIFLKCAQYRRCTSADCVNNHYAEFEYEGMKTFGITD